MKKILLSGLKVIFDIVVMGVILFGASWLITCGIVKLITLCFGIDFTWGIGTGVWLILFLIGTVTGKKK